MLLMLWRYKLTLLGLILAYNLQVLLRISRGPKAAPIEPLDFLQVGGHSEK